MEENSSTMERQKIKKADDTTRKDGTGNKEQGIDGMIVEYKLGWSKENKNYYLWEDEDMMCNACRIPLMNNFILNTIHNKTFRCIEQKPYCLNCFEKVKRKLEGTFTLVTIQGEKPDDLVPVFPDSLLAKPGNPANSIGGQILSDADLEKEDAGKLDFSNLKVSLNPNRNIDKDAEKNLLKFQKRDKKLSKNLKSAEDIEEAFDDILKSKPLIEHEETKKLE